MEGGRRGSWLNLPDREPTRAESIDKIVATVQRRKGTANPCDPEVRRRGFTAAEVADRSPRRCRQTSPDISDTVGSRRISPCESGGRHPVPSRRSGRENEPE